MTLGGGQEEDRGMGGSSKGFVLVFSGIFEMGVMGVCLLLTGRSWERHERVDSPRSEGIWSTATKGTFPSQWEEQ